MKRRRIHVASRRLLLKASAGAWLGASLPTAKPQNPMRRVAFLGIVEAPAPGLEAFRSRLAELGWVVDGSELWVAEDEVVIALEEASFEMMLEFGGDAVCHRHSTT